MAASTSKKIKPFRWDVSRSEQLGGLLDGDATEIEDEFLQDLRLLSAKVMACGVGAHLVFVGRSVENLFDYLSGILSNLAVAPRLTLLHFSNRNWDAEELAQQFPDELAALRGYFRIEGLDPKSIATAANPIRFIDVVSEGGTFGNLTAILRHWCDESGEDWRSVQRRIGFIGITRKTHNSPNTWRWWQHQDWMDDFRRDQVSTISVPPAFWSAIANDQDKVTPSHPHYRWADERTTRPRHSEKHLKALRLAAWLYQYGASPEERGNFVRHLTSQPQMSDALLRSLVLALR